MQWLKTLEPIILTQYSSVPYVSLENGVLLCGDNLFAENFSGENDYFIKFSINKCNLKRQSTHYYKIKQWPFFIPLSSVIQLDNIITNGRINTGESHSHSLGKKIALIAPGYIDQTDDAYKKINNYINHFEHVYLLTHEINSGEFQYLSDQITIIDHINWHRTMTVIAHSIYGKYHHEWTKCLPRLSISLYGSVDSEEVELINKSIDDIGISNKEIFVR